MSENSQLWIHLNKRCFEDNGTCPYCQIATLQAKVTELEAENAQARRTSQFHKDNHRVAGARLALLEKSNTTMKEAHEHILEYWNRDENDGAMADALWHIIETSAAALQAAVYLQEPAP